MTAPVRDLMASWIDRWRIDLADPDHGEAADPVRGPWLSSASRALSYLLGSLVFVWSGVALSTGLAPLTLMEGALRTLGVGFVVPFSALLFLALLAWVRIDETRADRGIWHAVGLRAAGGVATLALTCTLLGISLGIGSLAHQPLTPETVHEVIKDLTGAFSTAFLTSVVGLPTAAALRALIAITAARRDAAGAARGREPCAS